MKNKIRIAVIGAKGFPAFGGASRASESVVNILKNKFDYTIYAINTHTNKQGFYNGYYQVVFKGYKGKRINTLMYYLKSLTHALFVGKYDIIQINHTSSGFIVPFLRIKYKVVATARGIIPKDDNKWNILDKFFFNFSSFFFFRFSNICITVSEPHIKYFKKYTNKKILYIPNGIDVENIRLDLSQKDNYLLFSASRIISLKGAHVLLDALEISDYTGETIFIGNLDHTPQYANNLIEKSRNKNIKFIGLIKDKIELFKYIKKAKLFIFPSFNEGMSNMLLEVASLKTPIICSDIPENKAIFNENDVLFFRTGNAYDLAKKIIWANNNYGRMEVNAENAFKKVFMDYSWELIANKYEKVYNSII